MASVYDSLIHQGIKVHRPGELEYERSVANANLLYRYSRPNYVVQPTHTSQIQAIVNEAQADGAKLTIKNGGHSYAGFSTAKTGILLDLVKMNDVHLALNHKEKTGTVTVQGGALWGHAYKTLVNGGHNGWIINGGRCPTVGATGFTLGGGLGPFTRSVGMGCDTLISATIVTANGQLVTVKNTDDPKSDNGKLFWALRGAGGGNFGVVVKMKMRVEKLKSDDVVAGRFTWYPVKPEEKKKKECCCGEKETETKEEATKVIEEPTGESKDTGDKEEDLLPTMNAFYAADWSEQMTIDSSWLCDLKDTKSDIAVRFLVYYDGSEKDFDKEVDEKLTVNQHLTKQLKRRTLPEPSTRFLHETLVAQWSEEIQKSFPTTRTFSLYTSFSFSFGEKKEDKTSISKITAIIAKEMKAFRKLFPGETGLLQVTWIHTGGRAKKPEDRPGEATETAFPWREADYHAYIMIQWEEKFLEKDMRGFMERFKVMLREFAINKEAAFINFPDETLHKIEKDEDAPERAYFGPNVERLRKIKKHWDSSNFFHWDQGVRLPEAESKKKSKEGAKEKPKEEAKDEAKDEAEEKAEEKAEEEAEEEAENEHGDEAQNEPEQKPKPPGLVSNSELVVSYRRMASNVASEEVGPAVNSEVVTAVRDGDILPEPVIDEQVLTDAARDEWDSLGAGVANITNTQFTGGVHSMTDLGF